MSLVDELQKMIINNARENSCSTLKFDISGAAQFYKWLSYMPDFYQQYLDNISSKCVDDLSLQELCDYTDFKKQQKVVKELEQFFTDEWYLADIDLIEEFINSHSLSEIKKSKLTDEEYQEVISRIRRKHGNVSESTIDIISEGFRLLNLDSHNKELYDDLSMIDAFIFDFENNLEFNRSIQAMNEDCNARILRNEKARALSFVSASKTTCSN